MTGSLTLKVVPEVGTDDLELDRQILVLRSELLELPIGSVNSVHGPGREPGTKSGATLIAGALSVTGVTAATLRGVVGVLKDWMERNKARQIHITSGEVTIDLAASTARTEREMIRLLEQLLNGHSDADE